MTHWQPTCATGDLPLGGAFNFSRASCTSIGAPWKAARRSGTIFTLLPRTTHNLSSMADKPFQAAIAPGQLASCSSVGGGT